MSTSLRRFAESIATRKVMGWSFPMTLPTWAKPSSESPAEIRSTAALSTWSVSTRACGPNSRTMEAATLVGGGAWIMSELIPDAETQHVGRAGPGLVAQQLVVALERRVVGRLVRETERGDAPRERLVPGRAGGNGGLRIVPLVPHERVQLVGRRPREPAREGRVGEARLTALLAAFADAFSGRKPRRAQPVHEIDPVAQALGAGDAADRAYADLPPGGGNHVVVEARAVDAVERRGLVCLVDDPDGREHETGAHRERVGQAIVEVGLLQGHLAARLGTSQLGVLDLEL